MTWRVDDLGSLPLLQPMAGLTLPARISAAGMAAEASSIPALTQRIFPDHWWDEKFWGDLRRAGAYYDAIATLTMADPPDAATTQAELAELMRKQDSPEREARRAEILEEADRPPPFYVNSLFLDAGRRPMTRDLMLRGVEWSRMFVMVKKHKYKRPRPSQLEPRLKPTVPCPQHPAYPSGHSTQSHFLALLFGRISGRADVETAMFAAADRISENREYAGLHYKSDGAAGVQLSRQIIDLFAAEFAGPIQAANKAEWA